MRSILHGGIGMEELTVKVQEENTCYWCFREIQPRKLIDGKLEPWREGLEHSRLNIFSATFQFCSLACKEAWYRSEE